MAKISQRLLPLLQLTRMALVPTAVADSLAALLLWMGRQHQQRILEVVTFKQCVALAMISIGLYGYGMSLNDIIDQRRDRQISPNRPLPSGRIGQVTAHAVCVLLGLMALMGGELYHNTPGAFHWSLTLVVVTGFFIAFYDVAAKYLAPMGLLVLGVIRGLNATSAAPSLPVIWHPLLLMNHVAIVSTVAYHWEQKRPALRGWHVAVVGLGLVVIDAAALGVCWWMHNLQWERGLLVPMGAGIVFVGMAIWIRKRTPNPREAGQTLMLAGLLWLIVYDAGFVYGCASRKAGLVLLVLLPIAYASVVIMRWWGRMMLLSQRPTLKRVEV